jgi:hypothetical protein
VFGLKQEQQKSTNLRDQTGILTPRKGLEIDKKMYGDDYRCSSIQVSFSYFKFIYVKGLFGFTYLFVRAFGNSL